MTDADQSHGPPSWLGRALYGGILAYMAIDGFRHNDARVEVARERGVPVPAFLVPVVTGMLFVASVGIVAWRYPRACAVALILFFLGTTPWIHAFWSMEGSERRSNKVNFSKNVALLGGAIVLLDRAAKRDE